jgi:O-antigen ligase
MSIFFIDNTNKTQSTVNFLLFAFGFSAFLPHGLSAAILILVLFLWVISKDQRQLHLARTPSVAIMMLLAAFALWPFVVAAISGWFTDTTTRLFHMARVALMLQLGLMITPSERLIAFKGLIWGGVLASMVILTNAVHSLPAWSIWHHLLEVKGSQSSRAMIMLAFTSGTCAAMWLKTRQQKENLRSLFWLLGALSFGLIVGSYSISRNAHIVLFSIPFVLLLHKYRSFRGLFISFCLFVLFVFITWAFLPSISFRFEQAIFELLDVINSNNCESSVGVRFAMYQMAWNQLNLHPLFGTGIGSFVDYWAPLAVQNCPSTAGIRQPHNDFLLFAMETGWPGLISIIVIILWFIKTYWHQNNIYGSIGLLLCATFIITGLVNSPMRDAGIGFVMIFLLASCRESNGKCTQSS